MVLFKKINTLFDRYSLFLLTLFIIILSICYSLLSLQRHAIFQSGGFDLGIYDQALWQYSHFLFPYNTVKESFILGDHFSVTLPLLAPLYWVWSDVKLLLIFQAVWISLSVIPVYLIAKLRKFSSFICFSVAFLYGLFYGIQFAVFFDFHPIVLGIGFLAWLIYFLESKKTKLLIIALILSILSQEDMGLALAGVGFIFILKKEHRKTAITFILLGFFSSLVEAKIVSYFSSSGYEYLPQISHNPIQVIKDLFNDPQKNQVWLYSLGWFSFLPILSPGVLAAVIMNLAQFFVTGPNFVRMWSPFTHHRAILAIFLFLGTLDALGFLKKKHINITLVAILLILSAMFQQYYYHFALNKLVIKSFWQHETWMDDNKKLISSISPNESVAAQQSLVPYLSHRKEIYVTYPRIKAKCRNSGCWWLDFGGKPKLMVVDVHPNGWLTQLLETNENFNAALNNMEKEHKISLIKQYNYAKLYRVNF